MKQILVCGGGARNLFLMNSLRSELPNEIKVANIGTVGFDADFIEAQAFAYLAVRHVANLPATYPQTTGVSQPVTCGARFRFK